MLNRQFQCISQTTPGRKLAWCMHSASRSLTGGLFAGKGQVSTGLLPLLQTALTHKPVCILQTKQESQHMTFICT